MISGIFKINKYKGVTGRWAKTGPQTRSTSRGGLFPMSGQPTSVAQPGGHSGRPDRDARCDVRGGGGHCAPARTVARLPLVSLGPRCSGSGGHSTRGRGESIGQGRGDRSSLRWHGTGGAAGSGGDGSGGAPVSNDSFWLTLQLRWGERGGVS
jgi:hypothetical protein